MSMRSKIKVLALLLSMISVGAWAQAQEAEQPVAADSNKQRNEADQKIYQMALRYNDPAIAKARLYDLIERNPDNPRYRELLANIYFEMEQYSSAALVALDLLQINDKSIPALEIAAYSLEQLGALDRALPHFESLHLLSGDLFSLYKTSYLQYSLKKYEDGGISSLYSTIPQIASPYGGMVAVISPENMKEFALLVADQQVQSLRPVVARIATEVVDGVLESNRMKERKSNALVGSEV